jgi:dihydroneopterin aldolase
VDTVFINNLKADGIIGIYDWERLVRQTLVLDLELATDTRLAAASDAIADTLDYGAIAERMVEVIENNELQLLEALAEQLATILLQEFTVPWVRLRLAKPGAVPAAREVAIQIERGTRPQ